MNLTNFAYMKRDVEKLLQEAWWSGYIIGLVSMGWVWFMVGIAKRWI